MYGLQFVIGQIRKHPAAQFQRTDGFMVQYESMSLKFMPQEAHVENRVMCDKGAAPYKILKFRKNLLRHRRVLKIPVRDPVKPLRRSCYPPRDIDQAVKFTINRTVPHRHCPYFDNPVPSQRVDPRGFDIEDHVFAYGGIAIHCIAGNP